MKHKVAVIAAVLLVGLMLIFPIGQKEVAGQSCPAGQTYEPCFSDRYDDGYCTCYVEKRALQSGLWSSDKLGGLGNAGEWYNNAPGNGLKVGLIPYPNSIAVWEAGPGFSVGHVAYVENISRDPLDGFGYSQMNGCNATCLNCVSWGHQNAKEAAAGTLHFIYPPTQNPQRLWPYEGFKIAYRTTVPPNAEVVNLQWYGGAGSYDLAIEVQRKDGDGNPIGSREVMAERFDLASDRFNIYDLGWPACPTIPPGTWYWRVKNAGSSNWSEWHSFELTWCDGSCAAGALTNEWGIETELGLTQGYCPAGGNPTPMPTSTPWPTATAAPAPTATSVPAPTSTPWPTSPPAEPRQASDLLVSPAIGVIGHEVSFNFAVRNYGQEYVTFLNIGPQGYHYHDGIKGGLWNSFAQGIYVGGGQTVNITAKRIFEWEGSWCIEHIPSQNQNSMWHDLPPSGYRQAQCFDVLPLCGQNITEKQENLVLIFPTSTPHGITVTPVTPQPEPSATPTPTATRRCVTATPEPVLDTPTITFHTPSPAPTLTPGPTDTPPPTATATPCASSLKDIGDFNCDCKVDVADIQLVANRWRAKRGDQNYEERFDLNRDGVINIIDIQLVSSRWGERC